MKSIRFTINIDENNFRKLENEKGKRKSSRSALIQEMIQYFFESKNQEDMKYIRGYKKIPEEVGKIAELEKEEYQVLEKDF